MKKVKPDYGYYFDDRKKPDISQLRKNMLNCYDEIVPGSHKRANRIQELKQMKVKIGTENFMQEWGKIVSEMHQLMREELMLLNTWTIHQADLWIDRNVDFNHVKQHEINGEKYLSIDPKIGDKYETG